MNERLDDSEWLRIAESLPLGMVRKLPHHGCSTSNSMKIEHDEKGLRAYCFKCRQWGFKGHNVSTIDQAAIIDAHRKAKREVLNGDIKLSEPVDFSQPIGHRESLSWLLGHGITLEEIEHFGIKYSESLRRTFIPVYYEGKLINWIGRTHMEGDPVKWWALSKMPMPYFDVQPETVASFPPDVCIVEDILSAIKVGRHIPCYALMGTTPSKAVLAKLRNYKDVYVWTDSDNAGDHAYNLLLHMITRYYPQKGITRIRTSRDPKRYSNEYIINKLYGG